MARATRTDQGGHTYHVLNRAVGRLQIFNTPEDYLLFLSLLREMCLMYGIEMFSYVLMPNHWHLLIKTKEDGDLSKAMHWLTTAHTRKVHTYTGTNGSGPLYQGRYKSFIVDTDNYLHTVARYIERNPVRAKLCTQVDEWRWGSAWLRVHGDEEQKKLIQSVPVKLLKHLEETAAQDISDSELEGIRNSVNRGTPYGRTTWVSKMIVTHNLEATMRTRGRPRKV